MRYIYKLPMQTRYIIASILAICTIPFIVASKKPEIKIFEYNPMIKFYNLSGQIQTPRKMLFDRVAITSASQTIDISAAGFTNVTQVALVGENNTATIASMPIVTIKSFTTTSVTFNTVVGNTAILAILQGLKTPTDFTGMWINVVAIGN